MGFRYLPDPTRGLGSSPVNMPGILCLLFLTPVLWLHDSCELCLQLVMPAAICVRAIQIVHVLCPSFSSVVSLQTGTSRLKRISDFRTDRRGRVSPQDIPVRDNRNYAGECLPLCRFQCQCTTHAPCTCAVEIFRIAIIIGTVAYFLNTPIHRYGSRHGWVSTAEIIDMAKSCVWYRYG